MKFGLLSVRVHSSQETISWCKIPIQAGTLQRQAAMERGVTVRVQLTFAGSPRQSLGGFISQHKATHCQVSSQSANLLASEWSQEKLAPQII